MLENNDRFLVIKYSKTPYDCIGNHVEVISRLGYCWFGKIGSSPSITAINHNLNEEKRIIVLYCQGVTHICKLIDVSIEKPKDGYPDYYNSAFYNRNIFPSIYFKLASIEPLSSSEFAKCISLKSRNLLSETVYKSMASFFYGEYKDCPSEFVIKKSKQAQAKPPKANTTQITIKSKAAEKADGNSCVYRIQGICTNKRCINYQYDCTRPSMCLKQKPV